VNVKNQQVARKEFLTMQEEYIERALFWTSLGFTLIPVQPDTKDNVPSFGLYLDQLQSAEEIAFWFNRIAPPNLAIVAPAGFVLLDFDDEQIYLDWHSEAPIASGSYTERTPSGGAHVVIKTYFDNNIKRRLKKGVEIKQSFIVYPSVVGGKPYSDGSGDIRKVDSQNVFTSALLDQTKPVQQYKLIKPDRRRTSSLDFIKQAYSCVAILEGRGVAIHDKHKRFAVCACPFHDDKRPSFWIDQESNLWGCHACEIKGDVINLYAELEGLTVREAIAEMRDGL
jgi:hypothetical protein